VIGLVAEDVRSDDRIRGAEGGNVAIILDLPRGAPRMFAEITMRSANAWGRNESNPAHGRIGEGARAVQV